MSNSSTLFYKSEESSHFSSANCTNICQPLNQTETETKEFEDMRNYCDEMWKTLPPETHIAIWSVIGLLLLLSVIEGILEQCYPFMPYQKLYVGTGNIPSLKVEKTVQSDPKCIELQEANPTSYELPQSSKSSKSADQLSEQ